jgi:arylsulfatase A
MRLGDYKLTESYETGEMELYNLKEDVSESKNLASAMPKKKQEMAAQFKAWQQQVKANMPVRK